MRALIVIDAQNDFAHPDGVLTTPEAQAAVPEVKKLVDTFLAAEENIYCTKDTHDENYDDSKAQFYKLLETDALKNAIILIYANKQDLPGAKNVSDIIQIYELDTIKDHIWHIQPCSAHTGEGLITGMKWLSDQLVFKSNNNFPVNPYVDYSESKNEKKKPNKNISESNLEMNNNIQNNINNIPSSTAVNEEEKIDNENSENK